MTTHEKKAVTNSFERSQGFPNDSLFNVLLFESDLDPAAVNPLSGATGLIQFMPSTAISLGTTTAQIRSMSFEQQLLLAAKYLSPYKAQILKSNDPLDIYLAVFYPAFIGKTDVTVLSSAGAKVYDQNKGFDVDKDGKILKSEIRSKFYSVVNNKRVKLGLKPYLFNIPSFNPIWLLLLIPLLMFNR